MKTVLHGVELRMLTGCCPVLYMDSASPFHEYAAQMLQAALNSGGKADSLYEYTSDPRMYDECKRKFGFKADDVMLARVRQANLHHVQGFGCGKRSTMLAVVLALALEKKGILPELWSMLETYKLDEPFREILRKAQQQAPPVVKRPPPQQPIIQLGVELHIVCRKVPVLGMEKASVFQETASWFLQVAVNSLRKADSLYQYVADKTLQAECLKIGFCKEDVFVAKLSCDTMQEANGLKAVGVSGKRSVMLSLVLALLIDGWIKFDYLLKEVCAYDAKLKLPAAELFKRVLEAARNPNDRGGPLDRLPIAGASGGGGGGGG
eukprot:CAMPEP_0115263200 /NCGR_PEP_ID=MMETSP0270-20121206/49786_1 /TAXON_ID=71861 /ORGANISM="Scrippsiella trochoidea, Strain CCMP3099" /LENGTH=320 /DNA_ID=CAMNT_0002679171 /DNA_START=23 /DNA_END=981 /DNA_ORIENTATION=+